jgi:uroporphyrinogen III methyltransferase/synthase
MTTETTAALQQQAIDIITFASSKTVRCFYQLLQQETDRGTKLLPLPDSLCIASIGPQTSDACREWLSRVDIEARDYTLEGLVQAIVKWVNQVGQSGQ